MPEGGTAGEFTGAFAICVVTAGEILDQNFQRVTEPTVTQETQFYFRLLESSSSLPVSQTVTLSAVEGGDADPTPIAITVGRVGSSSSYIGPFVLYPDAFDTVITQGIRRTAAQTTGPQKKVKAGSRRLKGTRQNQVVANVPQNTPFELALDIDTTATGKKPNLLLAGGQDSTQVRATLVTPQGKPFYAPTTVDLKVGAGQGQVLNLTAGPGPLSIYDFQYQAPSMALDLTDPSVYPPVFYGTISGSTVALPYRDGGYTLKFHWPMYYRRHNFKNMLDDSEYVSSGAKLPDEAAVQAFLSTVPTDTGTTVISFLKNFYFVNMPDPPAGSTTYPPATSPVHGFVDLNGNDAYDVGEPVYCANGPGCSLSSITSVNRFSHVLFDMSQQFDLSAANMLTTLQKEYHFAEKGSRMPSASGSAAALDAGMGCFVGPPANPSFVGLIRQLVCGASTLHNRYVALENQRLDFFPAPSSVVDGNTPQIVAVCSDVGSQRVAAGYRSLNKASRAQAVYTNTVVNCAQAGTYAFSCWWHYFFGGPP